MTGFSAAASKATCGRKYNLRKDANYSAQVSVGKAADAALARRGLKRKGPVSPKVSMQMAEFNKPLIADRKSVV